MSLCLWIFFTILALYTPVIHIFHKGRNGQTFFGFCKIYYIFLNLLML